MSPHLSSALMLLVVGVLWGLNWPIVKFMMEELPTFTIRAIAFPIAALLLAAIAIIKRERIWPERGEVLPLFVTGVFLIYAFNMLTSFGQSLTEASRAAIVAYTMPAITAALSVVYLKEKISGRVVGALLIGMFGITILASSEFHELISRPTGVVVMLCAAFCWSIGNIALKANTWHMKPAARAAWFFMISAVLSWPVVWVFENPADLQMPSPLVVAALVFHILGPMVTCYMLWSVLLTRLSVAVATISVLTAPVVGVLSSAVLLGDELTWQKMLALFLVVTSIGITHFRPQLRLKRRTYR